MKVVESSEYYNKVKKFVEEYPDISDENVYNYLLSLFPREGDDYGVPEFAAYELDHIAVKKDKMVFHHRGVHGDVNYDMSFVLKEGNKKEGAWI